MGTYGFSVPRDGARARHAAPAVPPGRPRRSAAPVACLLVLALALAGCAALGAALRSSAALQGAGFQNANVNVSSGSGLPASGLVTVTYSSGPAGNDQRDVPDAEKIVWDTFSGRFGALTIVKVSGGCTGPVCVSHSTELASVTYAQLAARFGSRPRGLEKESATLPIPGWAVALAIGLVIVVIGAATIVAVLILRRKKSRPPGPQTGWPPGSPYQVP